MRTTIHFEGLPGSGKTTASERFCGLLTNNGVDASWWLEEDSNHPLRPKESRAFSHEHNFPKIYLDAWRRFLRSSDTTVVLDGYALQSTVRFLYAYRISRTQIEDYFNRWQELATETMVVYFSVDNPGKHFDVVLAERGEDWSSKLYTYVERSPLGVAKGFQGKSGFVEFWSDYQLLCHELLEIASVPVHYISSRSWNDNDLELLAAQRGFLHQL